MGRYGNRGDEQVRQSPFFKNPREKYMIGLYVLKATQVFFFNLKGPHHKICNIECIFTEAGLSAEHSD